MAHTDDEDWLYRRGRYASGDVPSADATRVDPVGPPSVPPRPEPTPTTSAPPPSAPPLQPSAPAGRPSTWPGTPASGTPMPPPTPVADYAAGAQPRPSAAPRVRRPIRPRRIVATVGLLLVAFLVYLVAVPAVAFGSLSRTDATPPSPRPADQPGQLYVLAGSDSREGLSPAEQQRLGTGNDAGRRSDTLMLLYVPPSGKAALISIPRDSYVAIPGRGKEKINAAYAFGGPKLLVQTVEKTTGLHVDGYAEVGFGGFVNVVDAVGGITMCPKQNYDDEASNLHVKAGCQEFTGPTALAYARMRHDDPLGDLGRIQRQRELLGAMAKKVVSPLTVLLPWRYWAVTTASARAITIGTDDSLADVAGLGQGVVRIASGDGLTLTVPVANANLNTPAGSAVAWDDKAAKEMFAAIARGDTAALAKFQK